MVWGICLYIDNTKNGFLLSVVYAGIICVFFCSVPICRPRGCHWHPQARSQGPNDTRHPFCVAQQVGTIAATAGRMALMAAWCMAKFPLMSGICIISVQICWFPRNCPIKFNSRLKISRTKFTRLFWLTSWYSSVVSFPKFVGILGPHLFVHPL